MAVSATSSFEGKRVLVTGGGHSLRRGPDLDGVISVHFEGMLSGLLQNTV